MSPILFVAFFALANAQQLINLKTLDTSPSGYVIVASGNVSIYITASSDSETILNDIVLSAGGLNKTASEIMTASRFYQNSDVLQPWIVQGPVTVTTSATATQIGALTGSIYITTAKQVYDTNFKVIDLKQSQAISTNSAQSTFVVLNSNYDSLPYLPTTISSWKQSSSQVYLYKGVPSDNTEDEYSAIFSNPFYTTSKTPIYVENVEDFGLTLPIFYIRAYGKLSFTINNKYLSIADKTFTSSITTGFYMKSQLTSTESSIILHPSSFSIENADKIGINYIGTMPPNGYVAVSANTDVSSSAIKFSSSVNQSLGWQTNVGSQLSINSSGTTGGEFYLQYYVVEGDATTPNPNVVTSKTTSRPIQTTTQSSSNIHFVLSIICTLLGYQILQ